MWARLVWRAPRVSRQLAPRLQVSEEPFVEEALLAFQEKSWDPIERSRKQYLSRRQERLVDPPSASAYLPAAV
ncbi:MAG: hypothetical protein WBW02_14330 [Candidatus Sulfotelmatobacter sp.]